MPDTTLLDALTARGVLISVSVRYWRARKKLNPEDLGLTRDQVNQRLIALGHKKLVAAEAMQQLALSEGRAHALVEENSFPFLNGVARYLPNEKLEEVTAKLRELQAEFTVAQAEFLAQYEPLRQQALAEWSAAARQLGVDPEEVVTRIRGAFPPADTLARRFGFDVRCFQVSVPEVPTADLVELGTRQELIQARQQAARTAALEIEASCQTFIADAVATMREQTAKLCEEMLATINGTGSVHQKTLNRLLAFLEQFKALNVFDDHELEAHLERVRREFLSQTASKYRDSTLARQHLVQGLDGLRAKAHELAQQPADALVATFGQLGQRRFALSA